MCTPAPARQSERAARRAFVVPVTLLLLAALSTVAAPSSTHTSPNPSNNKEAETRSSSDHAATRRNSSVSPVTSVVQSFANRSWAPQTSCTEAAAFARETQHMIARIDPDTIDDWRTHQRLVGCRVTAAGATRIGIGEEAKRFYERLRAAGWTRTPDPRDAPHEASLRFRYGATDCVFNINDEARLGTDAEFAVNDSLTTRAGERRYQLLVLCMPALPADPR